MSSSIKKWNFLKKVTSGKVLNFKFCQDYLVFVGIGLCLEWSIHSVCPHGLVDGGVVQVQGNGCGDEEVYSW